MPSTRALQPLLPIFLHILAASAVPLRRRSQTPGSVAGLTIACILLVFVVLFFAWGWWKIWRFGSKEAVLEFGPRKSNNLHRDRSNARSRSGAVHRNIVTSPFNDSNCCSGRGRLASQGEFPTAAEFLANGCSLPISRSNSKSRSSRSRTNTLSKTSSRIPSTSDARNPKTSTPSGASIFDFLKIWTPWSNSTNTDNEEAGKRKRKVRKLDISGPIIIAPPAHMAVIDIQPDRSSGVFEDIDLSPAADQSGRNPNAYHAHNHNHGESSATAAARNPESADTTTEVISFSQRLKKLASSCGAKASPSSSKEKGKGKKVMSISAPLPNTFRRVDNPLDRIFRQAAGLEYDTETETETETSETETETAETESADFDGFSEICIGALNEGVDRDPWPTSSEEGSSTMGLSDRNSVQMNRLTRLSMTPRAHHQEEAARGSVNSGEIRLRNDIRGEYTDIMEFLGANRSARNSTAFDQVNHDRQYRRPQSSVDTVTSAGENPFDVPEVSVTLEPRPGAVYTVTFGNGDREASSSTSLVTVVNVGRASNGRTDEGSDTE